MAKPLRVGDIIRLIDPEYGQPSGTCVVMADEKPSGLVWFTTVAGGSAHVARRGAVRLVNRTPREVAADFTDEYPSEARP